MNKYKTNLIHFLEKSKFERFQADFVRYAKTGVVLNLYENHFGLNIDDKIQFNHNLNYDKPTVDFAIFLINKNKKLKSNILHPH